MRFLPRGEHSLPLTDARRLLAWALGSMIFAVLLAGLHLREAVAPAERDPTQVSDAPLHQATIARLRDADDYYVAVGEELRARGYPTRSVFNWRTPAHYRLTALVSDEAAGVVLRALAILVVVGGIWAFSTRPGARRVAAGYLVLGAMLVPLLDKDAVVFPEICSGVAIGLSLALYVRGVGHSFAAALGVVAVFLREIAVPYAAVCGILAIRGGRRSESLFWGFGALLYVVYYAEHASFVQGHIQPTALAHPSWIQFQGLPFILQTLHVNGWLLLLPAWVTALACALGLLGITAPDVSPHVRWSLIAYVACFAVVGQPFNVYWGWTVAPIWAYAMVTSVYGMSYLARTAFAPTRAGFAAEFWSTTRQLSTNGRD